MRTGAMLSSAILLAAATGCSSEMHPTTWGEASYDYIDAACTAASICAPEGFTAEKCVELSTVEFCRTSECSAPVPEFALEPLERCVYLLDNFEELDCLAFWAGWKPGSCSEFLSYRPKGVE